MSTAVVDRGYSENFSVFSPESAENAEIDFVQYARKSFEFWDGDRLERSISRFLNSSDPKTSEEELHPIEKKSISIQEDVHDADNVIDFPDVFAFKLIGEKSVNTLQEWECLIEEVHDDIVFAKAFSLLHSIPDCEFLEVPLGEFNPSDRVKLKEGVIFRLIIGFTKKPSGQRIRESICYVRQVLPRSSSFNEDTLRGL